MKRRFALQLLLVGLSVPWAAAQVPAGGEFQVDTCDDRWSRCPAAASSDAEGHFVVAWQNLTQGDGLDIFARRYDTSGAPLGSEFQVTTNSTMNQVEPAVASDAVGNFVVVWTQSEPDGTDTIFGRRYDAAGAPRGTEFQVNTYTPSALRAPAVASDAVGDLVVVWEHEGVGGYWYGIFGQRFDASGAPSGTEFPVSTTNIAQQRFPAIASDAVGNFVVVWDSALFGYGYSVLGRRFDRSGVPLGQEFTVTPKSEAPGRVASDAAGNFVVVWTSFNQDGDGVGVFARRYDSTGAPLGSEFQVNTYTTGSQRSPSVASDAAGNFVIAWNGSGDADELGVFAQRYDSTGTPRGTEFAVNTYTTGFQFSPSVTSDAAGNFVVAYDGDQGGGSYGGIFAQRFGGLAPTALAVDSTAWAGSDGNGILEPGESVEVAPSWTNVNGVAQTFLGGVLSFGGPQASGVSYELEQAVALYGTVEDGATVSCSTCFQLGVSTSGGRPAAHWDATLEERLSPDEQGQTMPWKLHIGESFTDVPKTSSYYRFVETLLHRGVTGGCGPITYCPASSQTREQMAVFALVAKEGAGYLPSACTTPMFADVPASSPYCRWIEELARRGVVAGCGGGNYCPTAQVAREQMPVFMLRTLDPALNPPACGAPMFGDVAVDSPYCRWIEELARRGVVTGCGNGNYCPADAVTREQMAVFISATFGLTLYGP